MDKGTRSLIRASLKKAKEKIQVTELLLENQDYEDAVSRSYYAVFHAAQAVLLTENLKTQTHQGVINLFGLHFVKSGKFDKKYGKILVHLKDEREVGDYEIYTSIDKETAKEAAAQAKEFISAVEKFLA